MFRVFTVILEFPFRSLLDEEVSHYTYVRENLGVGTMSPVRLPY